MKNIKEEDESKNYVENIIATAVGGVVLMIATMLFSAFFSSPPTRAEFDTHKMQTTLQYKEINGRLKGLETGQQKLINHLIEE